MSAITVPAFMCDDEYGCGEVEVDWWLRERAPEDWVHTRDGWDLCPDCVYKANEWDGHYLRVLPIVPTPGADQ